MNCPCCGKELLKCPVCGEVGKHKRIGGKFQDVRGITADDWRRVYELVERQHQERLELVHQIEVEIRGRNA